MAGLFGLDLFPNAQKPSGGLFGGTDQEPPNKWIQALGLLGATLQDVGNNGRTNNVGTMQDKMEAMAQLAQRNAIAQRLGNAFTQVNPVEVTPAMNDMSAQAPKLRSEAATLNAQTYAIPSKQDLAPLLAQGVANGVDPTPYLALQKAEAGSQMRILSPTEAQGMGFRPGSVIGIGDDGIPKVLQSSDVKSDQAVAQDIYLKQNDPGLAVRRAAQAETARHNRAAESSMAAIAFTPESMDMAAEQYLAGDKSVLQGLGRGNAGTAMRIELKNAIYRKALQRGMTGRQIATAMAEFEGLKSGERALGTRTAQAGMAVNELLPMIDQAQTAMSNVDRSGFLPWGKIQRAWQDNTNDPNLRRAHAAVEAVVNTWARAINPTGQGTDADKRRGEEMLSTAYDQTSFNAVLDQMRQEAMAARASPGATKQEFRDGYGQGAPSQAAHASPSQPSKKSKFIEGQIYKDANGNRARYQDGQFIPVQ